MPECNAMLCTDAYQTGYYSAVNDLSRLPVPFPREGNGSLVGVGDNRAVVMRKTAVPPPCVDSP